MIVLREVRCPKCNKKWADGMDEGVLVITCKCGEKLIFDRRIAKGER